MARLRMTDWCRIATVLAAILGFLVGGYAAGIRADDECAVALEQAFDAGVQAAKEEY